MRWVEWKIAVTATLASLLLACRAIAVAIAVCLAFSTHPTWWWTNGNSNNRGSGSNGGSGDDGSSGGTGAGDDNERNGRSGSYWSGPGPGLVWTSVLSSCLPYGGVVACLLFIMKVRR